MKKRVFLIFSIFFVMTLNVFGVCDHNAKKLVEVYDEVVGCENNRIVWRDGTTMLYDDGKKKTYQELLDSADIEDMFAMSYPAGVDSYSPPRYNFDPGRIRNQAFFKKLYGDTKGEVKKSLTTIEWMPRVTSNIIEVTTKNRVDVQFGKVSQALERLPAKFQKYVTDIVGAFYWRTIAGTNQLSLHSFGVAIDINLKYTTYWRWDAHYRYINQIPKEIVEIFEKYGFVWGGKWYHYDTMHFEYRPELLSSSLSTKQNDLEQQIGQMLMVGFYGTQAPKGSQICRDIEQYDIGGVILFDYNPINSQQPKNISSKTQLRQLTAQLQACSPRHDLLISVDQEGGLVQRLKSKYGFYGKFPKASEVVQNDTNTIRTIYQKMSKELHDVGINFDLAPVVDLSINPHNRVINTHGRSFGDDGDKVGKYALIFIDAMHKNDVLTSLKHFPGHGSSLGDTHKGYVDVTTLWHKKELEPYAYVIKKNRADTIMVAHLFNATIDRQYPASLSYKTIAGILRDKMHYDGVVITDDLQMGAIVQQFGLQEVMRHAINASVDILLFGNQLDPRYIVSPKKLVDSVMMLVKNKKIEKETIQKAVSRIQKLKKRIF